MSAQFISRNQLLFFAREGGKEKKNHTSNKNKLVNNFRMYEKKYKNFRIFMIKNLSYNKACLPLKKYLLKSIFYMFHTRQRQHFTKNNSPLPFFSQALPIICTPSANIKINCKAFCLETLKTCASVQCRFSKWRLSITAQNEIYKDIK